jgi:hypothetical protein
MDQVYALIAKLVQYVVNPAILVVFSFGLLMFVFGLVEFLYTLSKGGNVDKGRDHMLWGVVGMFIMVSVFGIIRLLSNTFGLGVGPGGTYQPDMSTFNAIGNSFQIR